VNSIDDVIALLDADATCIESVRRVQSRCDVHRVDATYTESMRRAQSRCDVHRVDATCTESIRKRIESISSMEVAEFRRLLRRLLEKRISLYRRLYLMRISG
jgi:hypothetical protein